MKKKKLPVLRVWWIPQVPMKPFFVPVTSFVMAKMLLETLADYDQFQLDNRIKGDYANTGGLTVFDTEDDTDGPDGSWLDWESDECDGIDDLTDEDLKELDKKVFGIKW